MTEDKYKEIKENYLNNIKKFMTETGGLFPHISVFGSHKNDDTTDAIIHIPIPDEFMKSEEMKEGFIDRVLPEIAKKVNERFTPYGVAWSSEAWVRTAEKEDGIDENWKDLPIKKEVLFVSIEFADRTEILIYEIKRNGKQVTDEGKLVDHIDLIEEEYSGTEGKLGGRFSNLLQKFTAGS